MRVADRSLARRAARCLVLAGGVAALLPCRPAAAGPRPYACSQGVDSRPDGTVELESWFSAEKPRSGFAGWDWWLGPVAGLTDRIEAGLFAIFDQPPVSGPGVSSSVALSSLRAHASWLLADKGAWPVDVRLRAEYGQRVAAGTPNTGWFTAILSRDLGRLNLTANLGGYLEFADTETVPYFVGSFASTAGSARLHRRRSRRRAGVAQAGAARRPGGGVPRGRSRARRDGERALRDGAGGQIVRSPSPHSSRGGDRRLSQPRRVLPQRLFPDA